MAEHSIGHGYRRTTVNIPPTGPWRGWRTVAKVTAATIVVSLIVGAIVDIVRTRETDATITTRVWSRQRVLMERRDFGAHGWRSDEPPMVYHRDFCVMHYRQDRAEHEWCVYQFHRWVDIQTRTTGGSGNDPVVPPAMVAQGALQKVRGFARYVVTFHDARSERTWTRDVTASAYAALTMGRTVRVRWSRAGEFHATGFVP